MTVRSAENSFQKGLKMQREGRLLEAMAYFEAAMVGDRKRNPGAPNMKYQSYFAVCMAVVTRDLKEAVSLCRKAAEREFYNPEIFYNLGRIHLLCGARQPAVEAYLRGLGIDRSHPGMRAEMRRLGLRRAPLFRFLRRGHLLNRLAGQLRTSLPGLTR
ncbi:MAG: hypothetical protein ACE5HD_00315 [Acidobacteriota bacterium]